MPRRAELVAGLAVLAALGVVAAVLGGRRARVGDEDARRSTYLAGPSGARGYAEALARLGVEVIRHRRSVEWLDSLATDSGTVVIVLEPSRRLTSEEARQLAALPADLVVAGVATDPVTTCLGYRVQRREASRVLDPPGTTGRFPGVRAELVRHLASTVTDSSRREDGGDVTCEVPEPSAVDTLLRTSAGRLVALALRYPGGRRVTMVADSRLFRNRALRETAAGPFAVGLVVPRYRRALVDELHHGYEISGSLAGATLAWSLHSPWGWAVWQLAVVGVLALLCAGVRFGPARRVIPRRRRSPLEHVRALATALAAARGHHTAARLMVQGLRRRLSRAGALPHRDLDAWLDGLAPSLRSERGRAAHAELVTLTRRPGGTDAVLRAATAVETLWEELKPT